MTNGTHDNPDYSLLGDDHVKAYRDSGGDVGYMWNGAPTLILTTTGRRSGQARDAALIFGRDGDDYVIVASVGGSPKHPAWYLNLQAEPRARIQVKDQAFEVVARTAGPDVKPRVWAHMNDVWPNYDGYQERTDRVIPVVILSPV
ncbi:MAG: nitroreductase family deazaflavin-dependent oxidoreductase [Actinomycetota bacterium]